MAALDRAYQAEARNAAIMAWDFHDRILLNLPTGSGKTYVAATIIRDVLPARCLFCGDQDELCEQPRAAIDQFAGVIPALEKAGSRAGLRPQVVVGSVQTLSRDKRLEYWPSDHFKYIIIDEAHRGVKQKEKIMAHFTNAKVLGITATPFRSNMRDLAKFYETVAYAKPLMDLVGEGYAPPTKVLTLPVEIDLSAVHCKRIGGEQDYDAKELSTTIAPYYEEICRLLKESATGRRMIVFLPLIESSKAFAEIARSNGITAIHVDGKSEDRKLIVEGFRQGRYEMICNAGVLSTGVDIPIADCFVNLCPTRSLSQYQQRYGRICRVLPGVIDGIEDAEQRRAAIAASGKPDALVIDFLFQHTKLTARGAESLIALSDEEAKDIAEALKKERTPQELIAIQKAVQENREKKLVTEIERASLRASGGVSTQEFAVLTGNNSLLNYEPVSAWELQPPSQKQISCLERWGIAIKDVATKGIASALMNAMFHRFKHKLATAKQLRTLRRIEVPHDPRTLGIAQASRLIEESKLARIKN